MANLYIIAGCNGAGKTTASFTILPEMLDCEEFINADEIARGLSPLNPDKAAIDAGRLMLSRIDRLITNRNDFAFETTLATKSYRNTILKAKNAGYNVTLLFFGLILLTWSKRVDTIYMRKLLNGDTKQELSTFLIFIYRFVIIGCFSIILRHRQN